MKIAEIYQRFQIPTHLQLHMLRVAAVGQYWLNHWTGSRINARLVIESLLVHDLGNLLKFDLKKIDGMQFFDRSEQDQDHWLMVQESLYEFGPTPHEAAHTMLESIGVDAEVIEITDTMTESTVFSDQQTKIETELCWYADMRVGPQGVTTIEDRLNDLVLRYVDRRPEWKDPDQVELKRTRRLEMEKKLLAFTDLASPDIDNSTLEPLVDQLRLWEVRTER